jgi:hypothetical protein
MDRRILQGRHLARSACDVREDFACLASFDLAPERVMKVRAAFSGRWIR